MIFLSNIGLGQFAIVFIECGVAGWCFWSGAGEVGWWVVQKKDLTEIRLGISLLLSGYMRAGYSWLACIYYLLNKDSSSSKCQLTQPRLLIFENKLNGHNDRLLLLLFLSSIYLSINYLQIIITTAALGSYS